VDSRDKIIAELRDLVAKQAAQLEEQAARIAELELALAKAKKDSSTSSKPPENRQRNPRRSEAKIPRTNVDRHYHEQKNATSSIFCIIQSTPSSTTCQF
jgi:hypothetical protein